MNYDHTQSHTNTVLYLDHSIDYTVTLTCVISHTCFHTTSSHCVIAIVAIFLLDDIWHGELTQSLLTAIADHVANPKIMKDERDNDE